VTPSIFLIQLAILLLPGVIWAHMDAHYAVKEKLSQFEFFIRALLFGLVSHIAAFAIYALQSWSYEVVDLAAISDQNIFTENVLWQIGLATGLGFLLSVIWLYATRFKVLTWVLQVIGATRSYGDEDVWDFMLNSNDPASEYVNIRDYERRLSFSGFVSTFSGSRKLREIVLLKADVHNFDGELLYSMPRIYLSFKSEGMQIEFPYIEAGDEGADDEPEISI
jgi:uncharacterized membrane protein (Fun14 family)